MIEFLQVQADTIQTLSFVHYAVPGNRPFDKKVPSQRHWDIVARRAGNAICTGEIDLSLRCGPCDIDPRLLPIDYHIRYY